MIDKTQPKVSVRIPAYNHVKYIRECLNSVLEQTFQDLEIIITDDGSTDGTADAIREYKDPRIKLNVFAQNQGCACAVADCVKRASGRYIANLCSDDAWEKDKLEKQVSFLDRNPSYDAVFTKVKLIDENSNAILSKDHFYATAFEVENRSKEEWLHYFFFEGNCLCIPSVLIKKEVYEALEYQDKRMAGLPDFDLWVKYCLEHELYIIDEKLTKFRLRDHEANTSGDRLENHIRGQFEYKQLLNHFLKIGDVETFKRAFPEYSRYPGPLTHELIPYFLGRMAYDTGRGFQRLWGLETLFQLMKDEKTADLLHRQCGFNYTDLHRMAAGADVFGLGKDRKIGELNNTINRLNESIREQQRTIDGLNSHIAEQGSAIHECTRRAEDLQAEIETIYKTKSWRITKPLRSLIGILGKTGRKNEQNH